MVPAPAGGMRCSGEANATNQGRVAEERAQEQRAIASRHARPHSDPLSGAGRPPSPPPCAGVPPPHPPPTAPRTTCLPERVALAPPSDRRAISTSASSVPHHARPLSGARTNRYHGKLLYYAGRQGEDSQGGGVPRQEVWRRRAGSWRSRPGNAGARVPDFSGSCAGVSRATEFFLPGRTRTNDGSQFNS
jgi:hypothetical protein